MQGLFVLFASFLEASSLCLNREERTKDNFRGTATFRGITERDSAQKYPNLSPPANLLFSPFLSITFTVKGQSREL